MRSNSLIFGTKHTHTTTLQAAFTLLSLPSWLHADVHSILGIFYNSSAVAEMGDRLATIDMGRKEGVLCPGLRPTSIPSAILIHPAVWPQQSWAKNWGAAVPFLGRAGSPCSRLATADTGRKLGGLCPFWGRQLGPHLTQCGRAEAYLHVKFHLDPSNCLATVYERHRQTNRTDRQRSDGIGQTVLQTVSQQWI